MKKRMYNLVEKTSGPHYGEVWRSELKTPEEVVEVNSKIEVMKWEPADEDS